MALKKSLHSSTLNNAPIDYWDDKIADNNMMDIDEYEENMVHDLLLNKIKELTKSEEILKIKFKNISQAYKDTLTPLIIQINESMDKGMGMELNQETQRSMGDKIMYEMRDFFDTMVNLMSEN
jgi:hypothetical protein